MMAGGMIVRKMNPLMQTFLTQQNKRKEYKIDVKSNQSKPRTK